MSTTPQDTVYQIITNRRLPAEMSLSDDVVRFALDHKLGALLWYHLEQTDQTQLLSNADLLLTPLRKDSMFARVRDATFQRIHRLFCDAGIDVIWLKGAVLARTVYPDLTLRPMLDLDCLVASVQFEAATQVMIDLGYVGYDKAPHPTESPLAPYFHRETRFWGGDNRHMVVELHTHLFDPPVLSFEEQHWFWTQQTSVTHNSLQFNALSNEAMLLHLAAHAILHHNVDEPGFPLRVYDGHLLLSSDHLDWSLVLQKTIEWDWTTALWTYLVTMQTIFGTVVPTSVLRELQTAQTERSIELMLLPYQKANKWHIARELPLQQKLQYWRYQLVPTRSYMVYWDNETFGTPPEESMKIPNWRLHLKRLGYNLNPRRVARVIKEANSS